MPRIYEVEPAGLRLDVNCFVNNGLGIEEIERWWLAQLDLPWSCLRAHTINRPSSAGRAQRNTLMYGTARLILHSTFVVQSTSGAIQEYAGSERPEWLDCLPTQFVRRRGRRLSAVRVGNSTGKARNFGAERQSVSRPVGRTPVRRQRCWDALRARVPLAAAS